MCQYVSPNSNRHVHIHVYVHMYVRKSKSRSAQGIINVSVSGSHANSDRQILIGSRFADFLYIVQHHSTFTHIYTLHRKWQAHNQAVYCFNIFKHAQTERCIYHSKHFIWIFNFYISYILTRIPTKSEAILFNKQKINMFAAYNSTATNLDFTFQSSDANQCANVKYVIPERPIIQDQQIRLMLNPIVCILRAQGWNGISAQFDDDKYETGLKRG